ncbi:MAG: 2-oxoacid:acceptor oxidoreductase family protein [Acetobacteraceae bacterium]|nr:2-oxoacid:acceptor oxidoreductase family protein [Acetobacteraceae bacterium]
MEGRPAVAKGRKWQVILSGAGGQGLILAGTVLGEAAAVYGGLNATCSQSYGVASRGGFTKAEVVISPEEIPYPLVRRPDVIVALTQEAYDRQVSQVGADCLVLYDSEAVARAGRTPGREVGLPLQETARKGGSAGNTNLVALGALLGVTGLLPVECLNSAVSARFPGPDGESRLRAVSDGWGLGVEVAAGGG